MISVYGRMMLIERMRWLRKKALSKQKWIPDQKQYARVTKGLIVNLHW